MRAMSVALMRFSSSSVLSLMTLGICTLESWRSMAVPAADAASETDCEADRVADEEEDASPAGGFALGSGRPPRGPVDVGSIISWGGRSSRYSWAPGRCAKAVVAARNGGAARRLGPRRMLLWEGGEALEEGRR